MAENFENVYQEIKRSTKWMIKTTPPNIASMDPRNIRQDTGAETNGSKIGVTTYKGN